MNSFPRDGRIEQSLAGVTVLIVTGMTEEASQYRIWIEQLDGIALQVKKEDALIDWLEHNIARKALVLIDDARLHNSWASELATEVRLLRSDVPVIVVADDPHDTDDDDEINDTDSELRDSGRSVTYAVEYRQVTFTSLMRSVEIAKLVAQFDRENQKRTIIREKDLVGQVVPFRLEGEDTTVTQNRKSVYWNHSITVIGLVFFAGIISFLVLKLS